MALTYNIDRKTAARLLNVSLRTIDRYLSSGKLSSVKNGGRVWLAKEDIMKEMRSNDVDNDDIVSDIRRRYRQADNFADIINEGVVVDEKVHETMKRVPTEDGPYKALYEELRGELHDKQSRLDQATYRIGQLEAQLQSMVPLVDFKKQQKLLSETTEKYSTALRSEQTKRKQITANLMRKIELTEKNLVIREREVETERLNKAVFATILFILLAMQPILWLILR